MFHLLLLDFQGVDFENDTRSSPKRGNSKLFVNRRYDRAMAINQIKLSEIKVTEVQGR